METLLMNNQSPEEKPEVLSTFQRLIIIAIVLSAFTGIVIGAMRSAGLGGSALLYIGVPTFIALAFASTSKSKSVLGATLKAITFIILISGPILQEGFICMIMAAPILYIAGALVAWPIDHYRKKKNNASKLNSFVLPSLLVLMSLEGVIDETSFDRINTIEHTQVIDASVNQIKTRMANSRKINPSDSVFGKLFPQPDKINADGISVGDRHWTDISYLKWIYWNEKRGKTLFEVAEHRDNFIRFKPVSDNSYLNSYLTWKESSVFLKTVSAEQTQVTWRIRFQRDIDPAWYVQPLQRYAVSIVAQQMVESLK